MGYASNFTGYGDVGLYITTSPEFRFNEWISNSEFKKHLILSEPEMVTNFQLRDTIRWFVGGRNYIVLLNLAESIAKIPYISPIPGLPTMALMWTLHIA